MNKEIVPSQVLYGISYSEHCLGPPPMTPDDVRPLPATSEFLFLTGQNPISAVKLRYYDDPEFRGAFD